MLVACQVWGFDNRQLNDPHAREADILLYGTATVRGLTIMSHPLVYKCPP